MARPIAELHEAFFWTCDECGRDNFGRLIELEPDSELIPESVRADAAVYGSITEGGATAFLMRPDAVACSACGTKHDVEHDAE